MTYINPAYQGVIDLTVILHIKYDMKKVKLLPAEMVSKTNRSKKSFVIVEFMFFLANPFLDRKKYILQLQLYYIGFWKRLKAFCICVQN